MFYIDLTQKIYDGLSVYPGDPEVHISDFRTGDGALKEITFGTHTGTHIDLPRHFIDGGKGCDGLSVSRFCGSAEIIAGEKAGGELNADYLPDCDILIISSGHEVLAGTERYYSESAPLSAELTERIISRGYKMVCVDMPTVDRDGTVHKALLGNGILIAEGLVHLRRHIGKKGRFYAYPLRIKEGDGSPVRAVFEWTPDIECAIFDVDGTILDSMQVWEKVTREFCSSRGLEVTSEDEELFRNMTLEESMPYIKNKYNLSESAEELKSIFEMGIADEYKYNIKIKPHAEEVLRRFKARGMRLCIATSTYKELCRAAFERLGIWELFDGIAVSEEVKVNKKNPDIYLLAAVRAGVSPEKCIVFEDITAGIKGAKKGGMFTCAVRDTSNEAFTRELKELADIYISDWEELC